MKAIWDAYLALYTWQTGIPIAFYAAITIAFIAYTSSSQLKRSLYRGIIGFVLAYVFVWLFIGSKLNIDARWWRDEDLRNTMTGILTFITWISTGIIRITVLWKNSASGKSKTLVFFSSIFLGALFIPIFALLFNGIFSNGDFFFFIIHYILYAVAFIGLPILSIFAVYFIFSKLNHPGTPLTVFCYLTISATTALMFFLSLITVHSQVLNTNALEIVEQVRSFSRNALSWLAPIIFLSGPFVLMVIIFHFRQTIGTWVGCICGLLAVTSIQLIVVKYPLLDMIRDIFRTFNLNWILVIYTVITFSLGAYYLWTLYRKKVDEEVESLHPLLAIGAVVFNVCFLYPLVVSSNPLFWGAWFGGINLSIGLIILFGRLRVLSRKNDEMEILFSQQIDEIDIG
jgi:hypothetical protein